MQETTTINQTTEIPSDYKIAVEEGLKTIDKLLQRMEINQAETARLRAESQAIANRVREKMKEF